MSLAMKVIQTLISHMFTGGKHLPQLAFIAELPAMLNQQVSKLLLILILHGLPDSSHDK